MNNTRDFLLIALFSHSCISPSCKDAPPNCEKLRNGKFYYFTKRTREKVDIERFDSLQLETYAKTDGSPLKSKIVWKGECKYDMFINAYSESKLTGDDSIVATTPSQVDIVFINDNFYVCNATMDVFNMHIELRDTVYFRR